MDIKYVDMWWTWVNMEGSMNEDEEFNSHCWLISLIPQISKNLAKINMGSCGTLVVCNRDYFDHHNVNCFTKKLILL